MELDPGIGGVCAVPLDHLDVCKPRNRNCFLYRQLAKMISGAIHAHTSDRHKRDMNYMGWAGNHIILSSLSNAHTYTQQQLQQRIEIQ